MADAGALAGAFTQAFGGGSTEAPAETDGQLSMPGDEWFVGSITNNDAREIKLPLSFLPKDKRFVATVYADDASVPTRTKVGVRTLAAGADDVWTLNLPASGGQAIWLRPER